MEHGKEIHWDQAQQKAKEIAERQAIEDSEYKRNVELALDEFWEAMASDDFRDADLHNIACYFGVEPDDLINRLI